MQERRRVLTVKQVSEELGVSRNLIYRQVKSGVIPAVKVGDRYLIPVVAFERWLLECKSKPITMLSDPPPA